jgi:hypothetical protein
LPDAVAFFKGQVFNQLLNMIKCPIGFARFFAVFALRFLRLLKFAANMRHPHH